MCVSVADLYDDHALPATAAQSLLCKAARKRKEVRRSAFFFFYTVYDETDSLYFN